MMKGISQALLWEGAGVGDGGMVGRVEGECVYTQVYQRTTDICQMYSMLVKAPAPNQADEALVMRGDVRGQRLVASRVPDHFEDLRHF